MQNRWLIHACALVFCLPLAVGGCSRGDGDTGADTADLDRLFRDGFNEMKAEASNAVASTSTDDRTTIPYDRSSRLTRQVQDAFAANLGENFTLQFAREDPAEFLTSGKARELYERELSTLRLPADSVAGATALMFTVAWELANARELSTAERSAILSQVTGKLRGDALERRGDADRQTQAELRLLTAALWLDEAYLRQTFPDQMRELSDAVHRDMQRMTGNDLRAQTVTTAGFVEK